VVGRSKFNRKGDGSIFGADFFITKELYISKNTKRTPLRFCLQSMAGQLRTILGLVLEIPIFMNIFVDSGSSQYLKLISMPQTPAVWVALASWLGSSGL
jgi:hypothetical protein